MATLKGVLAGVAALCTILAPSYGAAADRTEQSDAKPAKLVNPCYTSPWAYLSAASADCPLQWGGITLYGTIDGGVGYSSHGAAFNPVYPQGVQELIARLSHGPIWQLVPNGLQRSNIGLSAKEEIGLGWHFVANINADFDPYSFQIANGPASLVQNNMKTLANQSANGDSSRAGQFDNTQGYVGISSNVYGTLTVGRVNSFSADLVSTYDAMLGSYAFSLIGNSATYVSGMGDTETTRYETALKYLWSGQGAHAGLVYQFGGYNLGNGSDGAVQFDAGGDFGGLSLDGVVGYARDAVSLSLYGSNPLPAGVNQNDLRATLADIRGAVIGAKYAYENLKLYGGYEYTIYSPPSDNYSNGFQSIGGETVLPDAINTTAYVNNKRLQVAWVGLRYALAPNLDVAAAYYIVHQNDYRPQNAKADACKANTVAAAPGASPQGSLNTYCAGDLQAVSALLDFRPLKRLDLYAGLMYSVASGGIASGYLHRDNFAPTAGIRVTF